MEDGSDVVRSEAAAEVAQDWRVMRTGKQENSKLLMNFAMKEGKVSLEGFARDVESEGKVNCKQKRKAD